MTSKIEQTDPNKIYELIVDYYKEIELLTFQYGVKPKQMGFIMEGILSITIQKLKDDPNSLASEKEWLEVTLSVLNSASKVRVLIDESDDLMDMRGKSVFLFGEDEALHRQIACLEEDIKIPLILHYFQGKREEEIASLLGISENETIERLKQADSLLIKTLELNTRTQLVKLLGLLKKSYDRVGDMTDMEEIFAAIRGSNVELLAPKQEQKESGNSSLWKPVLLISIIMVFFGSIIFVSESYGKVDDRFLAKLEKDYEKAKEEKIETLQIKKEIFSQMWFVQQTDQQFATRMVRLRRQLEKGEELKREEIKKELEEMMESIELPSEMVEELIRNPLKEDESRSNDFLQRYLQRLEEIKYAYHQTVFNPNNAPWQQQQERPEIPEDLRRAMEKQNLKYREEKTDFFPTFTPNKLTEKMKESVHPSSYPYFLIIEKSDFTNNLRSDFNLEEVLSTLRQFEEALMETERNSELYHHLSAVYSGVIMGFIDDSWRGPEEKIFDYKGSVQENYRDLYRAFANLDKNSPLSAIFQPIVKEMEATNWRFSQKQRYFDYQILDQAITLAREGRLDEFSYENTPGYQEIPMDNYVREVYLNDNNSYLTTIEMTYNDFKHNPEPRYMGGNDPLQFLGLYELARAEENVSAVYNLTYNTMPFNEFAEQWKPGKSLFEGVDSIKFDVELAEVGSGNRREFPIIFMVNGKEEIRAKMVFVNYYWLISEVMN